MTTEITSPNTELRMFDRRILLKQAGLLTPIWLARRSALAAPDSTSGLIVHTRIPHNAEPSLDALVRSWITPNELFYVRSHAPVPKIDTANFRLSVSGLVEKPFEISLAQLQSDFKRQAAVATMTCAGNRRSEHSLVKEVSGVPWQAGAIGNAEWAGVRLSDLLKKAGIQQDARHVWFEGVDEIDRKGKVIPFGASIPLSKAMSDTQNMPGALVCYEMNGEPLLPDHGFPIRTVVPGYIGARSVKWLGKIVVSDRPSTNHYVATAYKLVTEGTPDEWASAAPLENFAINSVTCLPSAGSKVALGKLEVSGYALATGMPGQTIAKVELSTDGGTSWTKARFTSQAKPYCWRLWKSEVDILAKTSEIIVRAIDSAGNIQPETVAWNLKGYQFNAWHTTPVRKSSRS
jgi:sulfite oxidase